MEEKIFLKDFSILYVCLGVKYGMLEKRALEDAIFLRDIGGKPKILCNKNSLIYVRAKENDIEVITYKKKVSSNFDFNYYFFLKKKLKEYSFDLVHCYGLRYVWVLAFVLRRYPKVGLLLTLNKIYSTSFRKPLYQLLLRRVDTIFCFSDRMKEMLAEWLPIHRWKLKKIGAGVDFVSVKARQEIDDEVRRIGAIIPLDFDKEEQVETLINAFNPLLSSMHTLELFLYSEVPWSQMPSKNLIVDMLHARGIDYKVFLKEKTSYNDVMKSLDVFIGISNEPLDLSLINALVRQVPSVVPRNGFSEDIWLKKSKPFETYFWKDARELKNKCLKILNNYQDFANKIQRLSSNIVQDHSLSEYVNTLSFHYNKVYTTRRKTVPLNQANSQ